MNMTNKILDATPVKSEVLPGRKYLGLTEQERSKIKSSKIVPPKLGGKGFGGVLVEYKNPIYRVG